MEQLKRGGWVYVLHDSKHAGLAVKIKLGLNRLGRPIWDRDRDAPGEDLWKAHSTGAQQAAFVVVLATAALERLKRANELVEWIEALEAPVRYIQVTVEGKRILRFPCHKVVAMRAQPRRLVHQIDIAMHELRNRARLPRAPEGARGRYVLLSYSSKDADKAGEIRRHLGEAGIVSWDYGVSARRSAENYRTEIEEAIEKAAAVLIVLTVNWSRSDDCLHELEHAREYGRRCIWLRFGPAGPPADCESPEVISFRGGKKVRNKGTAQLLEALGPR